jgi:uncharacterized protein
MPNLKIRMKVFHTVFIFAAFYLMLALLFYVFQSSAIFYPSSTPSNFVYTFPYPHQEIFIDTDDNERVHGLLFHKENPKGTILYFHGNAGSLTGWGWIAEDFQKYNYDFLIVDYRSFGKSTGRLTEKNLYADAQAWHDLAKERIPNGKIIIYGRSIGTGVAIDLATKTSPDMLLLESPFTNLPELAWRHFPILPFRLLLRFRFSSDQKVKKVQCPVYIFHGTNDNIVPFRLGQRLFEKFPPGQATFYAIDGGGHNDLTNFEEYHEALEKILGQ